MNMESNKAQRVAGEAETGCSEETRFRLELEFVQCLANPEYLHHLSKSRFLDDPAMVGYIEYLQYWQQPEYAKFILYPWSLHFLRLLTMKEFRDALQNPEFKDALRDQQHRSWLHYQKHRYSASGTVGQDGIEGVKRNAS